ncbi:MAG: hypothetical protein JW768_04585 [Chitinispirillaceae bacterium]|nr:hypothetical protein [Chitinispirillaceae bacterium]
MTVEPLLAALILATTPADPASYNGFNGASWGSPPDKVRQLVSTVNWQSDQGAAADFPKELGITAYRSTGDIAGYPAAITYYFCDNRFFQATVRFNFNELKTYDFNYNVFRSVNEYYNAIRSKTTVFTRDIYDLLRKKYGKKKPFFKEFDPKYCFVKLDRYLKKESWNLRYHPYDYYLHIKTQSYARWDFPKTRVLFSIAIDAPEKRFDYTLSAASVELASRIQTVSDSLRMRGL